MFTKEAEVKLKSTLNSLKKVYEFFGLNESNTDPKMSVSDTVIERYVKLQEECDELRKVLAGLCSYVGNGFNDNFTPEEFNLRIRDGIDRIIRVEGSRK